MVRVSKKGSQQTLLSAPLSLGHAEMPVAFWLRAEVTADLQDFVGTGAAAPTDPPMGPRGNEEGDA